MMDTVIQLLIIFLIIGGIFFTFVAAMGVVRLPDVYARAHTASQTDTLGAGFAVAAVVLAMGPEPRTAVAVLLLAFIFVTNPTAAHAIARAAYATGVPPWGESTEDDTE